MNGGSGLYLGSSMVLDGWGRFSVLYRPTTSFVMLVFRTRRMALGHNHMSSAGCIMWATTRRNVECCRRVSIKKKYFVEWEARVQGGGREASLLPSPGARHMLHQTHD